MRRFELVYGGVLFAQGVEFDSGKAVLEWTAGPFEHGIEYHDRGLKSVAERHVDDEQTLHILDEEPQPHGT